MKKIGILALIVVVLALSTTALADAGGIPAVPDPPGAHRAPFPPGLAKGERLLIFPGASPETFPANETFFIAHGWGWIMHDYFNITNDKKGFNYTLELDGELLEQNHIHSNMFPAVQDEYGDHWRQSMWIYNFPDGLEGTHTFVSKYWLKCQAFVDFGEIPGPCDDPDELMLYLLVEATIDFE